MITDLEAVQNHIYFCQAENSEGDLTATIQCKWINFLLALRF